MTRHLMIFAACFLVGAVAATALRTALHQPYAETPAPAMSAPAALPAAAAPVVAPPPAPADAKPVNTLCPICGMTVDPAIPTATWQGKVIGFGCKACPPKFKATPEKYGPAAVQNRVVEE
jgi:YHS domain-containing protein